MKPLHAQESGDHDFGMACAGATSVLMMDEFRLWLESSGLLGRRPAKRP